MKTNSFDKGTEYLSVDQNTAPLYMGGRREPMPYTLLAPMKPVDPNSPPIYYEYRDIIYPALKEDN